MMTNSGLASDGESWLKMISDGWLMVKNGAVVANQWLNWSPMINDCSL